MADSASESDSSSIDGGPIMMPPSPVTREQLHKRIESLQQQNRVYKVELETYKLRVKALQEENRHLRQASVNIQAKAEQEEEFISNTLLKKIQALKKEKETLAITMSRKKECLTNDLSRKAQSDCCQQTNLEQLRREKVELENTLEQEQEALVNRLWKRMDKLEAEKRNLQNKAYSIQILSRAATPRPGSDVNDNKGTMSLGSESRGSALETDVITLSSNVQHLRNEVDRLKAQLNIAQQQHADKMAQFAMEERTIRDENLRLQRRLQLEMERREACVDICQNQSPVWKWKMNAIFTNLLLLTCCWKHWSGMMGSHAGILPIPSSSAGAPGVVPSSALPIRPRQALVQDLLSCLHLDQGLQLSCGGSASRDVIMSPPSPVSRCHMCNGHGFLVGGNQVGNVLLDLLHLPTIALRPRTPGDSNMSSPAPSPSPLEVVMSPMLLHHRLLRQWISRRLKNYVRCY
ncbi:Coiled-coil domain-containing protein 6 [Orchesella cincta]|uniref:Coiled-coil domain-containing protein 6 n=1 Tax=Orchesella cincta TaxID=48709 RepID=A0A1D2M7T1_ORCCI|nr:Coiled-coil domain-containing protein 6 [Orchesella cincta]